MSPTKFKECFKAVTGSTLTQHVQLRRMNLAESLLQQPSLSVEQVARAVGYTCTSRFSELFRREIGLLPSEYRAQLR
jgi:AraC-like DNA-binding protein